MFNKDRVTRVLGVVADLKVESEVEKLFREVIRVFGRTADVVIANAGLLSENLRMAEEDVGTW